MNNTKESPLISCALFAYNQEQYIEEAIKGAFSQTYSSLEIILSDDASSDGTFRVMERMAKEYNGSHKVVLNRNEKNLGFIQHVNKVFLEIAKGEIIVVAAGDDISLSDRVENTWKAFESDPEIMSVSMKYLPIDNLCKTVNSSLKKQKQGLFTLDDYLTKRHFPILGCTRAYKKMIYTKFGALNSSCGVEDSNLVFRSMLLGKIFHLDKIGVKYRININSMSNNLNNESFEGIIIQRKADVKQALNLKLIDRKQYLRTFEIIESSRRKHFYISNLTISNNKLFYFLRHIFFNKDFPWIQKQTTFKSIIKSIIKSKFNILK